MNQEGKISLNFIKYIYFIRVKNIIEVCCVAEREKQTTTNSNNNKKLLKRLCLCDKK